MNVANGSKQVCVKELTSHRHLHFIEGILEHIVRVEIIDPAHIASQLLAAGAVAMH